MTAPDEPGKDLPRGVIVVANPYSGARENRQHVDELLAALRARDLRPRAIWQLDELHEAAATPGFAEEYRAIIAAGGDGTLNRVINQQTGLPLLMFPLGNENLFAQEFGCPSDPQQAADVVAAGRTRAIDLGRAGSQLFSIVASAGFDGEVAHRLARWRKDSSSLKRVGDLSYAQPILESAYHYRYPMLEIDADGQKVTGALAMIFNLPRYCYRLPLAPAAVGDDGLLDWIVMQRGGPLPLASYAISTLLNRLHERSDVTHGRAKKIRLTGPEPVPLEIDGEAAGFAPIDVEVVPAALRVLVP
jgi:diacylglycerol kinase (ATP)